MNILATMKKQYLKKELKTKEMQSKDTAQPKVFIGIDIHKRSWKIHTATDLFDGRSITMPPKAESLRQYIEKHYPRHNVYSVYESGCCGYRAHRSFKGYGWRSLVVNPADISKTGKSRYQKTDKIDARLLCRELKDGRISSITIPDVQREQLRCLFRRRNSLVKDFRKVKTKLKMQLLYLGISIPEELDKPKWTHAFRNWVKALEFSHSTAAETISSQLEQYEFIDYQIRKVSVLLRKYCRRHYKKDYYLLRSIPGIGSIVACGILSELGDLRRFSNFKQLASYVGLVPSLHESGDNSRTKGVTPRANRIMRSYFVEASWQALRYDPVMQQYYRKHAGKDVKRIIIKVARKLLSRTLAIIKTETPYAIGVVS